MALEGLHHVTAITADAPGNLDFYTRLLGLRMVKKTVNFDQPDVYHLYYGDETGAPGSIMTFFEFPGAARGTAGAGMVHSVQFRVPSAEALAFWARRLGDEGVTVEAGPDDALRFADPEGLGLELLADGAPDAPLAAAAQGIAPEHAITGFHGVRAYSAQPGRSDYLLDKLGFTRAAESWELRGEQRGATYGYDAADQPGRQGAGTVHHVAWSAADDEELGRFREIALEGGAHPTEIIDRQYFHSVYFREPSGVLFELASRDIGFTYDEPENSLGQALKLPPQHEHRREELERTLTPL